MVPLFSTGEYHTAICLGSVVGKDLSNHARDSRVLSMLLILRKLSKHQRTPLNIIAENYQDQTSGLAVVPLNRSREADFVNTTAIKSRSLVMNLAYPEIQDALSELIVSVPNTPEVGFIETRALGIQGATTSFGAVQHILSGIYKGRASSIGYFHENKMCLCPLPTEKILWSDRYRIIVIYRKQTANLKSLLKSRALLRNLTQYGAPDTASLSTILSQNSDLSEGKIDDSENNNNHSQQIIEENDVNNTETKTENDVSCDDMLSPVPTLSLNVYN